MRNLWIGVALLTQASCFDSSEGCTEIGCGEELALLIRPAAGGFVDGFYEIEATLDDRTTICSFNMLGGFPSAINCNANFLLDGADPHIRVSLLAFSTDVSYTVKHDGNELAADALSPTYTFSQPNGEDCGPTCRQAVIDVDL